MDMGASSTGSPNPMLGQNLSQAWVAAREEVPPVPPSASIEESCDGDKGIIEENVSVFPVV
jgi:hypothetical protein